MAKEKPKSEHLVEDLIREAAAVEQSHAVRIKTKTPEPQLRLPLETQARQFEWSEELQARLEAVQTHDMRMKYFKYLFRLALLWIVFTGSVIMAAAWQLWGFHLSDKVLMTFITATTADVLALFLIVAKWLFPTSSISRPTQSERKRDIVSKRSRPPIR